MVYNPSHVALGFRYKHKPVGNTSIDSSINVTIMPSCLRGEQTSS